MTTVRITLHNRSDSGVVIGGLRAARDSSADTVRLAAGAMDREEFTKWVRDHSVRTKPYFFPS